MSKSSESYEGELVYKLLEQLGLSIRQDAYKWQGHMWVGPFSNKQDALKAAFAEALMVMRNVDSEYEQATELAPRGETPWNHSVSIHEGALALYWQQGQQTRIRTFTRNETEVLLLILNEHTSEIMQ